jgi:OB-fold nucleic acid binding domain.
MSDYYKKKFIADLKPGFAAFKVCVTGVVTNVKVKEKYIHFTIDDSTGVLDCLLFRSSEIKNDIIVGSIISAIGEYATDEYRDETMTRLKVSKYSLITDINEELHNYLATFTENMIASKKDLNERIKQEVIEEEEGKISVEKTQKRIPLSKETIGLRLRTYIFKCLKSCVVKNQMEEQPSITFTDILTFQPLVEFCQKEGVDIRDYLENCLLNLEIMGIVTAILDHSQDEVEGPKYIINRNLVDRVEDLALDIIKKKGSVGIHIDDLFKELNEMYSLQVFIFSKEYIWEILDRFFEKNKIYLSKKNVFHYVENL